MKYLSGSDLVEYISERQSRQVRSLVQSRGVQPKLAIVSTNPEDLPSQKYIQYKKLRGEELGIEVEVYEISQSEAKQKLQELAKDRSVHGMILQLPLSDPQETEELISLIPPQKDVDGMTKGRKVEPATAGAILWLLAGYNIDLKDKNILIIGQGILVGRPLINTLKSQDLQPISADINTDQEELAQKVSEADIIISAAGSPGLIKPEMLKDGQIVTDAGTAEDGGELRGDVDPTVYESNLNLKITPITGGVGPLTIAYLFENLLQLIDKNG